MKTRESSSLEHAGGDETWCLLEYSTKPTRVKGIVLPQGYFNVDELSCGQIEVGVKVSRVNGVIGIKLLKVQSVEDTASQEE